jgi:lipopolysaccharide transport system ATP-binding protein
MIDIMIGFDANMTGRENIIHIGRMRGLSTKFIEAKMDQIIDFSELGTYIDMPVKVFSAGMQSRLIFSVVTTLEPDIMLLDEWLSTGDADFINKAQDRVFSLVDKARCLLLASHSYGLIQSLCNKLLVLDSGRQVYYGTVTGWNFDERKAI